MGKEKWSRLSPSQKVENLNSRVTIHECDSMETAQRLADYDGRIDYLEDYVHELDNRIDAVFYAVQELVAVLKANKQVTQDQAETVVGLSG